MSVKGGCEKEASGPVASDLSATVLDVKSAQVSGWMLVQTIASGEPDGNILDMVPQIDRLDSVPQEE